MTAARRAPPAQAPAAREDPCGDGPGPAAVRLACGPGVHGAQRGQGLRHRRPPRRRVVIVEIKKTLNLALVVQAVQRQRMTDTVYVAVPRPPSKWKWWRESRGVFHLLRRLELGLLLVSPSNGGPPVDVVFHPRPLARRRRAPSRRAVLAEISGRVADYNIAGSTRKKLVTAYRESAVHIACCLLPRASMAPAALRALGTGPKTLSILHDNVYGWFERVQRGVYALSERGGRELRISRR